MLATARGTVRLREHADDAMRGFEQRAESGQRKLRCACEGNA